MTTRYPTNGYLLTAWRPECSVGYMMSPQLHELARRQLSAASAHGRARVAGGRRLRALAAVGLLWLADGPSAALAQAVSAVNGVVRDEQDAAVPGVSVALRQPSSGLERHATTDAAGRFEITNLPVGTYDITLSLAGLRRAAPSHPGAHRRAGRARRHAGARGVSPTRSPWSPEAPALDTTSAGTRHAVSVTRIERMPVAVTSRGLESVLVAFPGFAQNANGAIHPRGAHNQMTFVVDGLADQRPVDRRLRQRARRWRWCRRPRC